MTNKKGFLLGEEGIKLILAVIAILFLIAFIVFLYNTFSKNEDLDEAKASLEYLVAQIDSGSFQAEVFNPVSWGFVSYSSEENMPKFCSSLGWEKCVCMCKVGGNVHTAHLACLVTNKDITCLENDFTVNPVEGIIVAEPPLTLSINQGEGVIQAA